MGSSNTVVVPLVKTSLNSAAGVLQTFMFTLDNSFIMKDFYLENNAQK